MSRTRTLFFVLAALLPSIWLEGVGAQALKVGANINAGAILHSQSNQTITVNPTNPANLFLAADVDDAVSGFYAAFSLDGGYSWQAVNTNDQLVGAGDDSFPPAFGFPSASFDDYGNLFLSYLDVADGACVVLMSVDGGRTLQLVLSQTGCINRPKVATGAGTLWVAYEDSHDYISAMGIQVAGLGQIVSVTSPEEVPGSLNSIPGDLSIGPLGQVVVVYQDFPNGPPAPGTRAAVGRAAGKPRTAGGFSRPRQAASANIWVSTDADGIGPGGFGSAVQAATTAVVYPYQIPAMPNRGIDAEPSISYDRSAGPNNGRLYLAYTDVSAAGGAATIVVSRYSDTDGAAWSPALKVNDDETTSSHFLPRVAVDETTGFVGVSWYDCRNDLGQGSAGDTDGIPNDDAQYWASESLNGAQSFLKNVQISTLTSTGAGMVAGGDSVQYGDYSGVAFYGGILHPAWSDNSNSTGDNPFGVYSAPNSYVDAVALLGPPASGPTNLSATPISSEQVNLNWATPTSLDFTQYLISKETGTGVFTLLAPISAGLPSYSDTDVVPNTIYTYRVFALNSAGVSVGSNFETTTTLPVAPADASAVPASTNSLVLSWTDNNATTGSTPFLIFRNGAGAGPTPLFISAGVTGGTDAGLTPNTSYTYQIFALNAGGRSTGPVTFSGMTFPNAPSALQATTVSPYEIDETWTDNNVATGSTQFLLFRQQGAETPAPLLIPAGDTSGNDVGLSPNTLYTYQLYAINAGGWSAPSNSWSATTLPLAPTNLAVKALNARTVSVSWTDTNSDTGSTQFLLFRQQGGLTPVPLVIPAGTSSVRDTGLSPNTIYTYQVFAINAGGQSAGSNLMSTTMPNG